MEVGVVIRQAAIAYVDATDPALQLEAGAGRVPVGRGDHATGSRDAEVC